MAVNAYKMCGVSLLPKVLMVNSNFKVNLPVSSKYFKEFFIFQIKSSSVTLRKLQRDKNTCKLFALCQELKTEEDIFIFIVCQGSKTSR